LFRFFTNVKVKIIVKVVKVEITNLKAEITCVLMMVSRAEKSNDFFSALHIGFQKTNGLFRFFTNVLYKRSKNKLGQYITFR